MAVVVEAAEALYSYPQLWRILTKSCYFLSTGLAGGSVLFHTFVLRPALRQESAAGGDQGVLKQRSAWLLAFAGIALLLAGYPQFAGKVTRSTPGLTFADGLMPSAVLDYLQTPAAKGAWMSSAALAGIQLGIYIVGALLLISLLAPPMRRRVDQVAAVASVVICVAALTLMVPLRAADVSFSVVAIHLVTTLHPYAGGFWIGALVALSGLALVRGRLGRDSAAMIWARVWKRFSIMAQVCVAVLLVSGLFQVWEAVSGISQLWTTTYGHFLLLKLALVGSMLAIGAINESVMLPRIARLRAGGDRRALFAVVLEHFPRLVVVEVVLGLGVLAVMPFLNGSSREELGQEADPPATGGIAVAMVLLLVAIVASFVANARVQSGIEAAAIERADREVEAEGTPVDVPSAVR